MNDFRPEAALSSFCLMPRSPGPEACEAAGCHSYDEMGEQKCYCSDRQSCEQFNGTFSDVKCMWDATYSGDGEALDEARKQGGCEGIEGSSGGPIERYVADKAQKCCASHPQT